MFYFQIILDNGPASREKTAAQMQEAGDLVGDPFEISTLRRDVSAFILYLCLYHPENGRDTDNVIKWTLSPCN